MGLLSKRPPEADPIRAAANDKVSAAVRFSKAMSETGEAFDALFDADRQYLAAYRERYGAEAHSGSLMMNRFRWLLLCELELSAPDLLKYLDQPRQSRARCHRLSDQIARQIENDLSSLPTEKEPAK